MSQADFDAWVASTQADRDKRTQKPAGDSHPIASSSGAVGTHSLVPPKSGPTIQDTVHDKLGKFFTAREKALLTDQQRADGVTFEQDTGYREGQKGESE